MQGSNAQTDAYLRIAALSMALYDYLLTLPAEWRFYRSQSSIMGLSVACILFILIRYTSILILFISNYGYFATSFTQQSCQRFFRVAPVFKVVQTMVSQAILGVRTVNIARRTPWVKWVTIFLFTISTVLEWFTNLVHRDAITVNGNCSAGNYGAHLSAWVYYLLSMLYDLATLAISTAFLFKLNIRDQRFSRLPKIMLYDGLGYFIVLTASNILNIILYRMSDPALQSSGACLGFAVVWIMSQRLLIHLREMAPEFNKPDSIAIPRNPQSSRDIAKARFNSKSSTLEAETSKRFSEIKTSGDMELAVQVHVEQSVSVDYQSRDHDGDHHRQSSFA